MSLPEISRRCLACGASVRAGARFCPQCGHNLGDEEAGEAEPDAPDAPAGGGWPGAGSGLESDPAPRAEVAPRRPAPPTRPAADATMPDAPRELRATREVEAPPGGGGAPRTREVFAPRETAATPREAAAPPFAGGSQGGAGAAGGRARVSAEAPEGAGRAQGLGGGAGRSRGAAARVRETVMPRVEKMRDEALVVLDETPDDSGLRFVLIAVVLFGLFLLFLLLSTTVLR